MSNASNNIPRERLVRKSIEQVRAEWGPEDESRLAETDKLSDEEITRRAKEDPNNPPLTGEQLERMRRSAPVARVRQALDEIGNDHKALAEVLDAVAEHLRAHQQAG